MTLKSATIPNTCCGNEPLQCRRFREGVERSDSNRRAEPGCERAAFANTPVLRQPSTNQIGDIAVVGYAGKHADPWGKEFGQSNTIWLVKIAGLRIVHLGDNGPLREDTIKALGRVDVLLMPIDSQFHILKADQIAAIRSRLFPPIMIPMHFRHEDLETNPNRPEQLGGIDDWAKGETNVQYLTTNKQSFSFASLPKEPEVLIFKHSPLVKPPPNMNEKENPGNTVPPRLLQLLPPAFQLGHYGLEASDLFDGLPFDPRGIIVTQSRGRQLHQGVGTVVINALFELL